MHLGSAPGKILTSLGEFSYLTIDQIIALHYKEASRSYVRKEVKGLLTAGLAMALPRATVTQPRLFTLTGDGQRFVSHFGCVPTKRIRRSDEQDKGHNSYFVQHTIAITDVLIRAKLLSQAIPGITLHRLYGERELKRKIYVAPLGQDTERQRPLCLEPDASLHFVTAGKIEDFSTLRSIARICGKSDSNGKSGATWRISTAPCISSSFTRQPWQLLSFAQQTSWQEPSCAGLRKYCTMLARSI